MPSRNIRLMIVGGHPADTFDQAGGTLAHHVARGDSVTAIVCTTGARSHHTGLADLKRKHGASFDIEAEVQRAVEEKLGEARRACGIMGFDDVRDLGFEDDDILVTQDKIEAIASAIRDVKPDVMIAHHPYETGGLKLHATIGQSTIFAWQVAAGAGRGGQEPHNVPAIYFMSPMSYVGNNSLEYAGMARADVYVDITDVIDKKVEALDQLASQRYTGPYTRKRSETSDGGFGNNAGVAYAEQFQSFFPMVRYTLPVTDYDLEKGTPLGGDGMARRSEIVGGLLPLPPGMAYSAQHRVSPEKYGE